MTDRIVDDPILDRMHPLDRWGRRTGLHPELGVVWQTYGLTCLRGTRSVAEVVAVMARSFADAQRRVRAQGYTVLGVAWII